MAVLAWFFCLFFGCDEKKQASLLAGGGTENGRPGSTCWQCPRNSGGGGGVLARAPSSLPAAVETHTTPQPSGVGRV